MENYLLRVILEVGKGVQWNFASTLIFNSLPKGRLLDTGNVRAIIDGVYLQIFFITCNIRRYSLLLLSNVLLRLTNNYGSLN